MGKPHSRIFLAMLSAPVRPAAVAGLFYPEDPQTLAAEVQILLAQAQPQDAAPPPPKAIIAPHAGYIYSGSTAAAAFSLLEPARETIRRVILIGPSHRVAFHGVAVPSASFFDTPLGRIEVDTETVTKLSGQPGVVVNDGAHAQEHSLEVMLPFLQATLENFRIVPLVVGLSSPVALAELIEQLWGGAETLIVISSDLSHYLPYSLAVTTDGRTAEEIVALLPSIGHEQACGATGINALLLAAKRRHSEARLLALRNSGDTAGERSRVVGYMAASFTPGDQRPN